MNPRTAQAAEAAISPYDRDGEAPVVSILTPAFNVAEFIEYTIESVLRQTFRSFELLIVDDGSTDDTMAIAARYARLDPRIKPTRQANGGIATARNAAIARSRGRFFALLDSDDLWLPTYLAEQIAVMEAHPEIGVLSANAINFGGVFDGEPLLRVSGRDIRQTSLLELIRHVDSMSVLSVFRREVTQAIGPFDGALRRSEDYDYWLRAASAGFTVAINPKPLALYRRRPNSLSATESLMLQAMRIPLEKLMQASSGRSEVTAAIEDQLARLTERTLIVSAREAIVRDDMTAAERLLGDLARSTGNPTYRVAYRAARHVPALARFAYACKRGCAPLWNRLRRHFSSPSRLQRASASI